MDFEAVQIFYFCIRNAQLFESMQIFAKIQNNPKSETLQVPSILDTQPEEWSEVNDGSVLRVAQRTQNISPTLQIPL